jgi:hypothetical protein
VASEGKVDMNSPTAAFLWQIWRRQRGRLIAVIVTLACFALFYPALCRSIGLDLNAPNALDNLVAVLSRTLPNISPLPRVFRIVLVLFLLLGPLGCMIVSQLYASWIFTFLELDEVKGFAMPARLFRLPVSPNFLSAWLMGFGGVAVTLLYLGWTHLVHLPRIDVFNGFPNLLVWLSVLWVSQAIVWSLDGFPKIRIVALFGLLYCLGYLAGPSVEEFPIIARNKTPLLMVLVGFGWLFGLIGLNKLRQGAWQTVPWSSWYQLLDGVLTGRRKSTSSVRFRSVSAAQLWFEWRKTGCKLLFCTCGLVAVGLLVMTVVSIGVGGLSDGDLSGLFLYLLAVPLLVHFMHGVKPESQIPQFIATHPLTTGEMLMAKLKASALSATLSWIVVGAGLALLPLLGDVHILVRGFPLLSSPSFPKALPLIALLLVVLTWRLSVATLGYGFFGRSWIARVPLLQPYATMALFGAFVSLERLRGFDTLLEQFLPFALLAVLVFKLGLAIWTVRMSLQRGLLTLSATLKYAATWSCIATALILLVLLASDTSWWRLSICLGILILLPLARMGFYPMVFHSARHR